MFRSLDSGEGDGVETGVATYTSGEGGTNQGVTERLEGRKGSVGEDVSGGLIMLQLMEIMKNDVLFAGPGKM